jgi:hypothetical protein
MEGGKMNTHRIERILLTLIYTALVVGTTIALSPQPAPYHLEPAPNIDANFRYSLHVGQYRIGECYTVVEVLE